MRAELPGFYFDADRNRYFPISSKRSGTVQSKNVVQEANQLVNSLTHTGILKLVGCREVGGQIPFGRNWLDIHTFQRQYLETQTSHPRVWRYERESVTADGALEHLHARIQTDEGLKDANVLTWGGSNGCFGIFEILSPHACPTLADRLYTPQRLLPPTESWHGTETSLNLLPSGMIPLCSSKVTSIRRLGGTSIVDQDSPNAAIVTSLGSAAEGGALHVLNWNYASDTNWEHGCLLPFRVSKCVTTGCSVWTAACCGATKATLGTSKGAGLVDLERASFKWIFRSRSDVLSQQCDSSGTIVLCGLRNGNISTVDLRISLPRSGHNSACQDRSRSLTGTSQKSASQKCAKSKLIRSREDETGSHSKQMQMGSAICSMVLLHSDETYVLASAMNGTIQLWDRRLVEKGAVQSYEGHYNTHTTLQLGVDPTETLLASGGEDCTIRLWNVRSGRFLCTMGGFASPANTICWPELQKNSYKENSICGEPLMEQDHSWGMWLGSVSGVLYMHGAAS